MAKSITTWKSSPEIIEALNTNSMLSPKSTDDEPVLAKTDVIEKLDALFMGRVVADDDQDVIRDKALTSIEVCDRMLPGFYDDVPYSLSDDQGDDDVIHNLEVRQAAQAVFWTFLSLRPDASLQRGLSKGIMLIEAKVSRPVDGTLFEKQEMPGRFYTSNPDLVLRYHVLPRGKKWQDAANREMKNLRLAEDRFPDAVNDFRLGFATYFEAAVGVLKPYATPAPAALNGNGAKSLSSKSA